VALPSLPVLYSTPLAAAVADFVATHYDLPGRLSGKLLRPAGTIPSRFGQGRERSVSHLKATCARRCRCCIGNRFSGYLDREGIPVVRNSGA